MFKNIRIKTRILRILAVLASGYILLLAMVQFSAAATVQSYATQSVSSNVHEIAEIIEQTAVSSQHSVDACQKLSTLTNELTGLVGSFKVGRGYSIFDSALYRSLGLKWLFPQEKATLQDPPIATSESKVL